MAGNIIPRFRIALNGEDIAQLEEYARQGDFSREELDRFETNFARYVGRKEAVFLSSARYGLAQILKFLNLSKRDGVILPAFTHYSVPSVVAGEGLAPLFCDMTAGSYNMTPDTINADYLNKAKVMIATHLYGGPAPVEDLEKLAEKHGIILIEDVAQALGAETSGRRTGTFGLASYFSLSITKNLTTLKGGMVCTDDENLAEFLRRSRSHAFAPLESALQVINTCKLANSVLSPSIFNNLVYPGLVTSSFFGIDPIHEKFREKITIERFQGRIPLPHPVQARAGNLKLAGLDQQNAIRAENGKFLLKQLADLENIILPEIPTGANHIFMSFVIMTKNSWEFKKQLLLKGIDTSPGYLKNNADLPVFSEFHTDCPMARKMEKNQLHLPVYPGLTPDDLSRVAHAVMDVCRKS